MTLSFEMKPDAFYFIPLGGCGVFGANMALYGHQGAWIMVDCGMGFADDTMPGVDILLPDPAFVQNIQDDLLGIVITHGHEDHIGALRSIWPRINAPIYATAFTMARIKQALSENAWGYDVPCHVVDPEDEFTLGPFRLGYLPVAHSIPEAFSLAISVPKVGTLLHTGDWKIDPEPIIGNLTDLDIFKGLGDAGVLAMMGDSTNAMVPGHSGSEGQVRDHMMDLFSEFKQRIVVTCFATNVARVCSIIEAAHKNGRAVCLVGRSLWSVLQAAQSTGYLTDLPPVLEADEAADVAPDKIVYICTGSQGESRAALARIAAGEHSKLKLSQGDVVIFSSRTIPGNERAVDRIKNRLTVAGVQMITTYDAPIHVSGHPYREELKQMYQAVRPKIAIPVHGEWMQMEKHAELALEHGGVQQSLIPENGQVIEITQERARVIDEVHQGILAIEGGRVVPVDHEAILMRRRMMFHGMAVVTIVVDAKGDIQAQPQVTALGLLDEDSEADATMLEEVEDLVDLTIKNMPRDDRRDDAKLYEAVRIATRRYFMRQFDRKPQTRVHLVRLSR